MRLTANHDEARETQKKALGGGELFNEPEAGRGELARNAKGVLFLLSLKEKTMITILILSLFLNSKSQPKWKPVIQKCVIENEMKEVCKREDRHAR